MKLIFVASLHLPQHLWVCTIFW